MRNDYALPVIIVIAAIVLAVFVHPALALVALLALFALR